MSAQESPVPQMSKGTLILACFVLALTNFMLASRYPSCATDSPDSRILFGERRS